MADLSKQTQDFKTAFYNLLSPLAAIDGGGTISATRFALIGQVKVKIDEMMPEGEGVQFEVENQTNVTNTLDLAINALLDESANILHQSAPLFKIVGKMAEPTPVASADGTGYVLLPTDFIRLQSFVMAGWLREVSQDDLITPTSPKYKLQKNKYTRGGLAKPKVVLTTRVVYTTVGEETTKNVKQVLEYYSVEPTPVTDPETEPSHSLSQFVYIPTVVAEDVQSNLVDALTWICAHKVLQVTGRSVESAKALEQVQLCYKNIQ